MLNRNTALFLLIISIILLAGCTPQHLGEEIGKANIVVKIASLQDYDLEKIEATLSRTGYNSVTRTMSISGADAVAVFENMVEGIWEISFTFYLKSENFEAAPTNNAVSIFSNQTITYNYVFNYIPGYEIAAEAGPSQLVTTNTTVNLDGSQSTISTNEPLTYQWAILTKPVGSSATLSSETAVKPTFTADLPGVYAITLTVSAGNTSSSDTVQISVVDKFSQLQFRIIDAEYSKQLDKIVAISSNPNKLYIFDPVTAQDVAVNLPLTPNCVSVGPDGQYAAVGYDAYVSYIDLVSGTLVKTINTSADVLDVVLAGNGYIYAFPKRDQWETIRCINIENEVETQGQGYIYAGTRAKLHPNGTAIYGANNGLSPSDIEKYDISGGTAKILYDSPYHGDYSMGGDLWFSEDGMRIFARSGNVFRASANQSEDMVYNGKISELPSWIQYASHSTALNKVSILPYNSTMVQIYDYNYLSYEKKIDLPYFVLEGEPFKGYGQYVFYASDGSKSYIITKADPDSNMLYDFAVVTYNN